MRPSLAGRADDRLSSQPGQTPAPGAVGALVFPEDGPDVGPYPSRRSDRAWASLADGIPSARHASRCQTLRPTLPERAFDGIRGEWGGRSGRAERAALALTPRRSLPRLRPFADARRGARPILQGAARHMIGWRPPSATERSHRGLVQRFAKPPCGVTCIEGSNPSLSARPLPVPVGIVCARSSADRALGCGPKGRGFESRRARQPLLPAGGPDTGVSCPPRAVGRGRAPP